MKHFTFLVCCLAIAAAIQGQVIHVPGDYTTIQEGISAANPGDTVLVGDGVYYEQISFLGKKPLMVASYFVIDSDTNHINNTIIDGSQLSDINNASVVLFTSGEDTTSILKGFTIRGGQGTYVADLNDRNGGGIFISGSGAKISYNKITGNVANNTFPAQGQSVYGGGIGTKNDDGDYWLVIDHNQVYENSIITQYDWCSGGGIYTAYNARITDNEVFNNSSISTSTGWGEGGGISHMGTGAINTIIIINNKIHHNTVRANNGVGTDGGVGTQYAKLIFINNEVIANSGFTPDGMGGVGGLAVIDPAEGCIVSNNVFRENSSTNVGGAMHLENVAGVPDPNQVLISDNYFLNNQAREGGAVSAIDIPIILINNVYVGNQVSERGGAFRLWKSGGHSFDHMAVLINNSFFGNTAPVYGGAIYSANAKPLIFNSVFFNDSSGVGPEIMMVSNADTLEMANCNINGSLIYGNIYNGGGNINEDPKFADTILLTLQGNSPCIDAGAKSYVCCHNNIYNSPPKDILGIIRPQSENVEIGAYEMLFEGAGDGLSGKSASWFHISPNPASNHVNISYLLDNETPVEISLYNGDGALVQALLDTKQGKGNHIVEFKAENLPSGIYICRIVAGEKSAIRKMVIVK